MFTELLSFHSLLRWVVLMSLTACIGRAGFGIINKRTFANLDKMLVYVLLSSTLLQFALGLSLYVQSPLVDYFLNNFKTSIHERDVRFFGLEHITSMTVAVCAIWMGGHRVLKETVDRRRFKKMLIWFGFALVLIFFSIPWSFSPFTNRPDFRWF